MLLSSSGLVSTKNICTVLNHLEKHYTPMSLPICVDFDSMYDPKNPTRCVPRSNLDNTIENTFYITKPEQALLNQSKLLRLPVKGDFYSILPCLNLNLEDNKNYSNNIIIEVISIGENKLGSILTEIKSIYAKLGEVPTLVVDEFNKNHIDLHINTVLVGTVSEVVMPDGLILSRGTALLEPVLSYALSNKL